MTQLEIPLVSVIIPFLNGKEWLIESIESVLHQSYFNWELILINDGSTDGAGDLAKRYRDQHPEKIKYTEHEGGSNKGVTASRNLGINVSKGSYIAFLDADDVWLSEKLEKQMRLFRHNPKAQMICEASRFWYSWQNSVQKDVIVNIGVQENCLYFPPQLIKSLYPLGQGQPPCPTGIIITKAAFYRSGGFVEVFSGDYQLYEDQAFLSKIYLSECVYISGDANNLYRKRSGSLTEAGQDVELYKKVRLFYLTWLEDYLTNNQLKNDDVLKLIQKARADLML